MCFLFFCICLSFVFIVKFEVFVFRMNRFFEFGNVRIGVVISVIFKIGKSVLLFLFIYIWFFCCELVKGCCYFCIVFGNL